MEDKWKRALIGAGQGMMEEGYKQYERSQLEEAELRRTENLNNLNSKMKYDYGDSGYVDDNGLSITRDKLSSAKTKVPRVEWETMNADKMAKSSAATKSSILNSSTSVADRAMLRGEKEAAAAAATNEAIRKNRAIGEETRKTEGIKSAAKVKSEKIKADFARDKEASKISREGAKQYNADKRNHWNSKTEEEQSKDAETAAVWTAEARKRDPNHPGYSGVDVSNMKYEKANPIGGTELTSDDIVRMLQRGEDTSNVPEEDLDAAKTRIEEYMATLQRGTQRGTQRGAQKGAPKDPKPQGSQSSQSALGGVELLGEDEWLADKGYARGTGFIGANRIYKNGMIDPRATAEFKEYRKQANSRERKSKRSRAEDIVSKLRK